MRRNQRVEDSVACKMARLTAAPFLMKTGIKFAELVIVGVLFLFAGCDQHAPQRPDHPRLTPNVMLQDVVFRSSSLGRDITYRVILPRAASNAQKLPVVYLLHGGGGDFHEWSNDSDVAGFAEKGLILVMPEGESSYYTNSVDPSHDRFEDYVVTDLISDVEGKFPADPTRRAVAGVSMGGFGAIKLALKHPGLYKFVGALSPAIDVPSRPFSIKRISQYRHHAAIFGAWGSQTRKENDPFILAGIADPRSVPYMYISCGEQEGLLRPNKQFVALLVRRKFQFEYHVGAGGHDWNQWNGRLTSMFESLLQHL